VPDIPSFCLLATAFSTFPGHKRLQEQQDVRAFRFCEQFEPACRRVGVSSVRVARGRAPASTELVQRERTLVLVTLEKFVTEKFVTALPSGRKA
jgi:hypothetical protein